MYLISGSAGLKRTCVQQQGRYALKQVKTAKFCIVLVILLLLVFPQYGCSSKAKDEKIPVRVLILPKFEAGENEGDFPGEAQFFYEEYLAGGEEFDVEGAAGTNTLYYKNGVAMLIIGQGKVSAALNTSAVLSDRRFDFSDTYILSVGCGGAAKGYGICGDVFVVSAAVDFDLGHRADPRELRDKTGKTWFHDESYDDTAVIRLDESLTERVYEKVKDISMETTPRTVDFLRKEYPGEVWAQRMPKVMRGTSVTGDDYWKGIYDHENALVITETYDCPDPFAITEMEDVAAGLAVKRYGLLERMIILRTAVNMDVFPEGITPEELWSPEADDHIASEDSMESVDIFETAMKNCFAVGKAVIDAILEGTL